MIAEGPKIISEIGKDLVEFAAEIASHLPEILQKGIEIIGELLAGIIQKVPDVISAIPGIISEIGSEFLNKDWAGIGWDIIKGIGSGIKSAASDLVSAAVQAAKDAVAAVKGWLGIKSPSRLMRDQVGKYMALGMGIGFEKNIPVDDMQKSLSAPLKKIKRTALDVTMKPVKSVEQVTYENKVNTVPLTSNEQKDFDYERIGNEIKRRTALDVTMKPVKSVEQVTYENKVNTVPLTSNEQKDFDYERIGNEIKRGTKEGLEGMGVYLDKKPVGKIIAPEVDKQLGRIGERRT